MALRYRASTCVQLENVAGPPAAIQLQATQRVCHAATKSVCKLGRSTCTAVSHGRTGQDAAVPPPGIPIDACVGCFFPQVGRHRRLATLKWCPNQSLHVQQADPSLLRSVTLCHTELCVRPPPTLPPALPPWTSRCSCSFRSRTVSMSACW